MISSSLVMYGLHAAVKARCQILLFIVSAAALYIMLDRRPDLVQKANHHDRLRSVISSTSHKVPPQNGSNMGHKASPPLQYKVPISWIGRIQHDQQMAD
ncbi:hypothetical protein BDV10DRAFT_158115 [Aspergillus recurvatus]